MSDHVIPFGGLAIIRKAANLGHARLRRAADDNPGDDRWRDLERACYARGADLAHQPSRALMEARAEAREAREHAAEAVSALALQSVTALERAGAGPRAWEDWYVAFLRYLLPCDETARARILDAVRDPRWRAL